MSAGLPKYVVVNLDDLEKNFEAGETVNLQAVKEKGILNISGREAKLALKVGAGQMAGPCLQLCTAHQIFIRLLLLSLCQFAG